GLALLRVPQGAPGPALRAADLRAVEHRRAERGELRRPGLLPLSSPQRLLLYSRAPVPPGPPKGADMTRRTALACALPAFALAPSAWAVEKPAGAPSRPSVVRPVGGGTIEADVQAGA